MIANHIHDALAQVRRLQEVILEKRRFGGYSGRARIASGAAALAGAWLLAAVVPANPEAHLAGWGLVLAVALVLNYGALAVWFFSDPEVRSNPLMLKPAIDAVPALAVGAFLTVGLVGAKQYDLLPGTWMCLYGLAQVAYRQSLPQGIYVVGLAYMACGGGILLSSGLSFLNPWPMGAVFFIGELAGGMLLLSQKKQEE